jgi:hypothetical protein
MTLKFQFSLHVSANPLRISVSGSGKDRSFSASKQDNIPQCSTSGCPKCLGHPAYQVYSEEAADNIILSALTLRPLR